MHLKRQIIIYIIVVLSQHVVSAQNPAWRNFVKGDAPKDILIDNSDIWIATAGAGIVKINKATNTKTFYQKDNSGIPANFVNALAKDADGNLWVGLWGGPVHYPVKGGIAKFNGNSWTHYDTHNSQIPANEVRDIFVSSAGIIWVATAGSGVARFDGTNWETFNPQNSPLPHDWVSAIEEDSLGAIYFATNSGLAKYDGTAWTIYNSVSAGFPHDNLSDLTWDKNGKLLVAGYSGLYVLSGTTWTIYSGPQTNNFLQYAYKIAVDKDNNYWIGNNQGLIKYDGFTWELFDENNTLMETSAVYCLAADIAKNKIYIGCGAQSSGAYQPYYSPDTAVVVFDGTKWKKLHASRYEVERYNRIISNHNGTEKWLWGEKWLSDISNYDSVISSPLPTAFRFKAFYHATTATSMDSHGYIWGGLSDVSTTAPDYLFYRYNPHTQDLITYDESQTGVTGHNAPIEMYVDKRDNVYVPGYNNLAKFDGNTWQNIYSPGPWTRILNEDSKGSIWFVARFHSYNTTTPKLVKIDTAGVASLPMPTYTISGDPICVWVDSEDKVWVVMSGMLHKFDPVSTTTTNYPMPAGVYPRAMVVDSTGNVWLAAASNLLGGLYKFDGVTWTLYDSYNSGLGENHIRGLALDEKGRIMISTEGGGVSVFDPNYVDLPTSFPAVPQSDFSFQTYPNPASNFATMVFDLQEAETVNIEIIDITGKLLSKQTKQGVRGENKFEITSSFLPNGVYILRLQSKNLAKAEKLIISR